MNDIEIDFIFQNFADFLSSAWEFLEKSHFNMLSIWDKKDLLDDWLESNWELLVVQPLCNKNQTITEYTAAKYRFINISNNEVNHEMFEPFCVPKKNVNMYCFLNRITITNINDLEFIKFVNWNGNSYEEKAPFNCVFLENKIGLKHVISREMILFRLKPYFDN